MLWQESCRTAFVVKLAVLLQRFILNMCSYVTTVSRVIFMQMVFGHNSDSCCMLLNALHYIQLTEDTLLSGNLNFVVPKKLSCSVTLWFVVFKWKQNFMYPMNKHWLNDSNRDGATNRDGDECLWLFQDESSPAPLTDLCLSLVSSKLELFCVKQADGSLCLRESLVFPQELADQLLCKMATEGKFRPHTHNQWNGNSTSLSRVLEVLKVFYVCFV